MSFDAQLRLQAGRCQWCQRLIPVALLTRDHLHPRKNGQRERGGNDFVLSCEPCNAARSAWTIGSTRFLRWVRGVINGKAPADAARPIRDRRRRQTAARLKRMA